MAGSPRISSFLTTYSEESCRAFQLIEDQKMQILFACNIDSASKNACSPYIVLKPKVSALRVRPFFSALLNYTYFKPGTRCHHAGQNPNLI